MLWNLQSRYRRRKTFDTLVGERSDKMLVFPIILLILRLEYILQFILISGPTLMTQILKGMENKFKESILFAHIIALKEEWLK